MTPRLLEQRFRTIMRSVAYSDKALARAFPDPATISWAPGTGMKQAEALRKRLGSAEFVTIVDAGHVPQVERPDVFVEAIRTVGE